MLLRNGSIYIPIIDKKRVKPKITIFTSNCLICSLDYKPGDCITSCNRVNISRHSFHINCLFSVKKYYSNRIVVCPYCCQGIEKPVKKYRFIPI